MKEERVPFIPHALTNITLTEELENMACISDLKVDDLTGDGHPQVNMHNNIHNKDIHHSCC
jgi:hypothetical protein